MRVTLYFLFLVLAAVLSFGTVRAFQHGGFDFNVFYGAWQLVLDGQSEKIFLKSTDRFLYAPGFAILLSPLAVLSRDWSLGLWTLLKTFALGTILANCIRLQQLTVPSTDLKDVTRLRILALAAAIFLARPLLVEYEYGQVNLFVLATTLWALTALSDPRSSKSELLSAWFAATFFAITKILTLPILLLPLIYSKRPLTKIWQQPAVLGVMLGGAITILSPLLVVPSQVALQLYSQWGQSLLARGLPLETHNQSFAALLYHYASGGPTPIHALSGGPLHLGSKLLSSVEIQLLSNAWTFLATSLLFGLIASTGSQKPLRKTAAILGMAIVPSYLIWKPYFIFGIPLAGHVFFNTFNSKTKGPLVCALALFIAINFLGFDFIGYQLSGPIEAASPLLLCHLVLLTLSSQVDRSQQIAIA